ncbi:DinB family protein [Planctomicrobium sp. SH661]|uniref:DinB family protein n=1 Tax=Planctomicrobium sp. SH661 TaxID=3448124 RepID=UPI003F5C4B46
MSYADSILPEFELEMANTRKVIAECPDDKFDWKAHPKSQSIGWNVSHLVEIASWVSGVLEQDEWDVQPPGKEPYRTPILTSREEALRLFDEHVAQGRSSILKVTDEALPQPWSLKAGGHTIFTMPREATIRRFVLSHIIHHRAFLCSYLRLNDLPVPGMYGPSETMELPS